jgi:hypothetical protein
MNDRYVSGGETIGNTWLSSLGFPIAVMVMSLASFGATESFAQQPVVTDKCAASSPAVLNSKTRPAPPERFGGVINWHARESAFGSPSGIGHGGTGVLRVYGKEQEASRSATQQREQSFNQDKSSGGWSTQNLNSEMQSRQSGAAQSDHYQNYQHSGGGWGGSHSFGGWGGGGRSWGGGGDRSWGGGGWRR